MLKILHGAAALVLAVLLELLAGDFALVLPLSGCVLHRITEKADYCVIFVSGFGVKSVQVVRYRFVFGVVEGTRHINDPVKDDRCRCHADIGLVADVGCLPDESTVGTVQAGDRIAVIGI